MRYDKFTYLYPLRAENTVPATMLSHFESQEGWIAQMKKNGTNGLVFMSPDRTFTVMGRHKNQLKMFDWTDETKDVYAALPGKGWYVLNFEYIDGKTPHIKKTHYLHDVLVANGEHLIGTTYAQRYKILQDLFLKKPKASHPDRYEINDKLWLARNFRQDFRKVFDAIDKPEDEGVVLKNLQGMYQLRGNVGWTVKCRRTTTAMGF